MVREKLPPIHPGTILKKEFLIPRKISQTKLADNTGFSLKLVKEVCQAKKPIDAEIAFQLGNYLGTSAELWLGLQQDYEQERLEEILERKVKKNKISSLIGRKTNGRVRKHT
ncbi:transcriptional regulator protein [Glomus cerebriforme]|uniref:Transcriptional regulator protein n=1 Tax=Glomus cerebriforme TaxID=658196 RepID=A0A397SA54_9GLOM|nr:transcriptional regulator protein [Glomus cerebriforme]